MIPQYKKYLLTHIRRAIISSHNSIHIPILGDNGRNLAFEHGFDPRDPSFRAKPIRGQSLSLIDFKISSLSLNRLMDISTKINAAIILISKRLKLYDEEKSENSECMNHLTEFLKFLINIGAVKREEMLGYIEALRESFEELDKIELESEKEDFQIKKFLISILRETESVLGYLSSMELVFNKDSIRSIKISIETLEKLLGEMHALSQLDELSKMTDTEIEAELKKLENSGGINEGLRFLAIKHLRSLQAKLKDLS